MKCPTCAADMHSGVARLDLGASAANVLWSLQGSGSELATRLSFDPGSHKQMGYRESRPAFRCPGCGTLVLPGSGPAEPLSRPPDLHKNDHPDTA
jgi:hypothetical protein